MRTIKSLAIMSLSLISQFAAAEPSPLSLQEAVSRSLARHPELAVSEYRQQAADGRVRQSTVGSRPELNLMVEDALGSGDFRGTDLAQTTLSIGWVIEDNLLDSREEQALSERTVISTQAKIQRLDVAARTARQFVTALLFQHREALAEEARQQAADALANIQRRVKAGKSASSEFLRAKAELIDKNLMLEDIEHEKRVAYRQLAALWGEQKPDFSWVSGNFDALADTMTHEQLLARLDNNPALHLLADKARLAESEVELARTEARARWRFNTGVRHYAATDDYGVVAGVTVPLGGEGRSRGRIQAAEAERNMVEAQTLALRIDLQSRLFALVQEWQHALHVSSTLQAQTLPLLREAAEQTQTAYERGRSSYQDWVAVRQELLKAQSELLDARFRAHINRIEIERLVGTTLRSSYEVIR